MPDIDELNDIYDDGGDDEKVSPPSKRYKIPSLNDLDTPESIAANQSNMSGVSSLNIRPYADYLPEGVAQDRNIDLIRGQNQSAWSKLGYFIPRTLAKIGTGLIEGIGYTGALLTEWGDDRDYSNALTEMARGMNQGLDENLPIYRTTNKTFGLGDLGWWLNNAEGIISSVGAFALEGAGFAKLLGTVGEASRLGGLARAATGGVKFGQEVARTATAGFLAYTEGAQMGKGVFDDVYKTQLEKGIANGLDPNAAHERAKHIAAESAATTVQLNTMLNTGMNMWSVLPFFNHEANAIENIAKKNFFKQSGESITDWGKRVGNYTIDNFKQQAFKGQGKIAAMREAALEGVEELTNDFAETTGREEGKKGRTHGIIGQLGQLSKYFDRTMNEQGALNFVMGAVAGPLTNVVTNNVPIHQQITGYAQNEQGQLLDKSGNVTEDESQAAKTYLKGSKFGDVGKWITSRTKNEYGNTQYFNNIKDAVQADINTFQSLHRQIAQEAKNGNYTKAEALKYDLFNLQSKRSVQLGFANNLAETYRQVADLDNTKTDKDSLDAHAVELSQQLEQAKSAGTDATAIEAELADTQNKAKVASDQTEAMQMGFTANKQDNTYKEKAETAIKDLKALQGIHEKVQKKYGLDPNEQVQSEDGMLNTHLADFIFDRYANLYLAKNQVKKYQDRLNELQSQQQGLNDVLGGDDLNTYMREKKNWLEQRTTHIGRQATAEAEDTLLEQAENSPTKSNIEAVSPILQKYGAIGVTENDGKQAIKETRKQVAAVIEDAHNKINEGDEQLFNSTGYKQWSENNPNKSFGDYQKEIEKKLELSEEEKHLHTNLGTLNDQIKAHTNNLREIETAKTLTRIRKATKTWLTDLSKERQKSIDEMTAANQKYEQDQLLQKKLDLQRMQLQKDKVIDEMEFIKQQMEVVSDQLNKLVDQTKTLLQSNNTDITKQSKAWQSIEQKKTELNAKLVELESRYNTLNTLYEKLNADISDVNENNLKEVDPDDISGNMDINTDNQQADDLTIQEDLLAAPSDVSTAPVAEPSSVVAPMADYISMFNTLPADVQKVLTSLKTELINGAQPFSYDALNKFVTNGVLSVNEARNTLSALQEYLKAGVQEEQELNQLVEETNALSNQPIPENNVPLIPDEVVEDSVITHDTAPIDNKEPGIETIPVNDKTFIGKKTINPVATLAGSDLEYTEDFNEKTNTYFKSAERTINPDTNIKVFNAKELLPGTKLSLQIDEQYNGFQSNVNALNVDDFGNIVKATEKFSDYLDTNGKINTDNKSIGNVPIKVVDADGRTVRYLRTVDWITAKYDSAGTTGESYRNVYDGDADDKRGIMPGNVARQAKQMLELRKKLIEEYNATGQLNKEIIVVEKFAGIPVLNTISTKGKPGEVIWEKASKLLPDTNLTLAIGAVKGDEIEFQESLGIATPKSIVGTTSLANRTWALLPAPNGQYHLGLLKGTSLLTGTTPLNTVVRAIELHLIADTKNPDILEIFQRTGFNLLESKGLKAFINQYFTYTSNWTPTQFENQEFSILDIKPPLKGEYNSRIIVANVLPQGNNEQYASLVDGKLAPNFVKALTKLFSQRLRNVVFTNSALGIRGINDAFESKFTEVKADKNGKFSYEEHDNYNEFIKNHLTTNVYGLNTITTKNAFGQDTQTYVYAVNPQIEVDFSSIIDSPTVNTNKDFMAIPDTAVEMPTPENTVNLANALSNLFDAKPQITINNALEIDGIEVTPTNLSELYNLAGENRNGKAIDEVYNYLIENGINTLYKGFNPFLKC